MCWGKGYQKREQRKSPHAFWWEAILHHQVQDNCTDWVFFSLMDFSNPKAEGPNRPVLGSHKPDLVPLRSASHRQGPQSPLSALVLISASVPHPLQEEGCGKEYMNHQNFESVVWPSLCYQAVSFHQTIRTGFLYIVFCSLELSSHFSSHF